MELKDFKKGTIFTVLSIESWCGPTKDFREKHNLTNYLKSPVTNKPKVLGSNFEVIVVQKETVRGFGIPCIVARHLENDEFYAFSGNFKKNKYQILVGSDDELFPKWDYTLKEKGYRTIKSNKMFLL